MKSQTAAFRPITSAMSGDASNIWCPSCDRERCLCLFNRYLEATQSGISHISMLTLQSPLSGTGWRGTCERYGEKGQGRIKEGSGEQRNKDVDREGREG